MPYGITQCYLPPDRGDIPARDQLRAQRSVTSMGKRYLSLHVRSSPTFLSIIYTVALYCRVVKVTRHVHRKPCNLRSRSRTSVQASIGERSDRPSRRTGLKTPRIAARSPSPLSNKKLSYRRVTARCVLSVVILPITTQPVVKVVMCSGGGRLSL